MYYDNINIFKICSKLDWLIFCLSIFLTFSSVIYSKLLTKKNLDKDKNLFILDYLVMGRKLTLPLFVATLCSTWYGNIFGVAQISFEHGIYNFITQGIFWYISYLIFALFLAKKVRNSNALTLPNLIENYIGPKSAKLSCILVFIKTIPISLSISLGIFLQMIFTINFYLATFIGVMFIFLYSSFGGLRTIVYSDSIQFVFMYLGVIAVIIFSYFKLGGLDYLQSNLSSNYFKFNSNYSLSYTFVWFFIAITTTFVNPTFYQRCFAAKNYKIARNGILISIFIWFLFDLCITFGGMYAKATIPNADISNGYLTYSLQVLPSGFRGLLLASILATILSTLDSFLFLSSNILFFDIKTNFIKSIKLKHILSIFITTCITFLGAILVDGKIEILWRTFRGYFASCLIMPFILCCTIKYYNNKKSKIVNSNYLDNSFVISSIAGIVTVTIWDLLKLSYIDSFYVGSITTVIALIIYHFKWPKLTNKSRIQLNFYK